MIPISQISDDLKIAHAGSEEVPPDPESEIALGYVSTADLDVDASYQRQITKRSRARLRKIMKGFSWRKFGAITVARQPGADGGERFAVIDGQHRALCAWALGVLRVPAAIVEADQIEAAGDFVGINTVRTTIPTVGAFRARVVAGEPDACAAQEIMTELKITLQETPGAPCGPRQTTAVLTIEKLVKKLDRGLTFTLLETLCDATDDDPLALSRFCLMAAGAVISEAAQANKLERFAAALGDMDLESWRDDASHYAKVAGGAQNARGADILRRKMLSLGKWKT